MAVLTCQLGHLRHLGVSDLVGIDAACTDAVAMNFSSVIRVAVSRSLPNTHSQYEDHELHRRVIIIQKLYFTQQVRGYVSAIVRFGVLRLNSFRRGAVTILVQDQSVDRALRIARKRHADPGNPGEKLIGRPRKNRERTLSGGPGVTARR